MKLNLLLILAGVAILSSSARANTAARLLGDVNGDGQVSVADAVLTLHAIVGSVALTPDQMAAADVAPYPGTGGRLIGNGKIEVQDVIRLLQYVLGLVDRAHFGPPDTSGPTLRADGTAASQALSGDKQMPATVEIPVYAADLDAMVGRVALSVIPADSNSPPLKILSVTAGGLLPSNAQILASPLPRTDGGSEMVASYLLPVPPATGTSGNLFTFVIGLPNLPPASAAYNLVLSMGDFADGAAREISVSLDGGQFRWSRSAPS